MRIRIAYIRVKLNDRQLKRLIEKIKPSTEELEEIPPQVVIYEGKKEADWIPVFPQILKVSESRDRKGKLILEGKIYPGEKPFEITIKL
ncbi:MAG: hypothetical protein ACFFCW_18985 [Candidatus Hodarchaeota archaeon]